MDRRTYFADVLKASFEEFECVDVVVASYENFERNWVCCGLLFIVGKVALSSYRNCFFFLLDVPKYKITVYPAR